MPILLEERIDTWNASVPTVLQILQCESSVLRIGFLSFQSILSPHTLRIYELWLPRLDVSVQVGNQLIFVMTHARTEVGDSNISLFRPPQIRLKKQKITHIINLAPHLYRASKRNTVELPFNSPQFKVHTHLLFNFNDPKVKFPPFGIFLSLVFKSMGPKRNLKWRFHHISKDLKMQVYWHIK